MLNFSDTGRACDFFSDLEAFQTLLRDAVKEAKKENAKIFAEEMLAKSNDFGLQTFLSERQLSWLCEIADWDIPERRSI